MIDTYPLRSARIAGLPHCTSMNNRALAVVLGLLTILFVVLNFTVEGAGTIFLILAAGAGLGAWYFFRRP